MQPTEDNVLLARTGHFRLRERMANSTASARRVFIGFGNSDEVTLPPQAVKALADVLEHLADGKEVVVTAHSTEMTTQQGRGLFARVAPVSRPAA